jgi:hypothetical protein
MVEEKHVQRREVQSVLVVKMRKQIISRVSILSVLMLFLIIPLVQGACSPSEDNDFYPELNGKKGPIKPICYNCGYGGDTCSQFEFKDGASYYYSDWETIFGVISSQILEQPYGYSSNYLKCSESQGVALNIDSTSFSDFGDGGSSCVKQILLVLGQHESDEDTTVKVKTYIEGENLLVDYTETEITLSPDCETEKFRRISCLKYGTTNYLQGYNLIFDSSYKVNKIELKKTSGDKFGVYTIIFVRDIQNENCQNIGDEDGDGLSDCQDPLCFGSLGPETEISYVYNNAINTETNYASNCLNEEEGHFCNDHYDNDGDGNKDCQDYNCINADYCQAPGSECINLLCEETNCADGQDNDADGNIDCLDSDCDGMDACEYGTEVSCNDNEDNDNDGNIDCQDYSCDGIDKCNYAYERDCHDGLDNDVDGIKDCYDSDCWVDEDCWLNPCEENSNKLVIWSYMPFDVDEFEAMEAPETTYPTSTAKCAYEDECVFGDMTIKKGETPSTQKDWLCGEDSMWEWCMWEENLNAYKEMFGASDYIEGQIKFPGQLNEDETKVCGPYYDWRDVELNCSDGIDNDDNGQTDCSDPRCEGQVGAQYGEHLCNDPTGCLCEVKETMCSDGFDNDAHNKALKYYSGLNPGGAIQLPGEAVKQTFLHKIFDKLFSREEAVAGQAYDIPQSYLPQGNLPQELPDNYLDPTEMPPITPADYDGDAVYLSGPGGNCEKDSDCNQDQCSQDGFKCMCNFENAEENFLGKCTLSMLESNIEGQHCNEDNLCNNAELTCYEGFCWKQCTVQTDCSVGLFCQEELCMPNEEDPLDKGGLNEPCIVTMDNINKIYSCSEEGLVCKNGLCKIDYGQACNNDNDCNSGVCEDNICQLFATPNTGVLGTWSTGKDCRDANCVAIEANGPLGAQCCLNTANCNESAVCGSDWECHETVCDDGKDYDNDNRTDCEDSDCNLKQCGDKMMCLDYECKGDPGPGKAEIMKKEKVQIFSYAQLLNELNKCEVVKEEGVCNNICGEYKCVFADGGKKACSEEGSKKCTCC